jgi:hypothetical protein
MANLVDYMCMDCNSAEGVCWDASASWDTDKQEMVLSSSYDSCECHICGSNNIEEVLYKESKVKDD